MKALTLKVAGSTDPFDDWYADEHGTGMDFELDSDVDECLEDDYNDKDYN